LFGNLEMGRLGNGVGKIVYLKKNKLPQLK
jgi:hypothetical protein